MNFAVEVVYHIFSFLSPCEIVRMRQESQVSKKFHDITHSHALWKEVYANARLLLPPGPFSWQSTRYLERTLVQSELVSRTWTSQPPKMHSRIVTRRQGRRNTPWTVVFGRWCIFLKGETVQCHDIDSNTYHSLYDGTAHPGFSFTAYAGATDINGHRVYLLLFDYEPELMLGNLSAIMFQLPKLMYCSAEGCLHFVSTMMVSLNPK
ncbi:hypothetical protein JVT61DRAFT_6659 [Boletus reticuloceps]|uniref:F-box domain-containing protein n=1 Tax=Boletus reticuloceps TaxID=495285 RepID=A0A8I3A6Q0_9AGAM|nr:hypothetical protein JVT61DRAFT_6659 [Boletus reticuloceps]